MPSQTSQILCPRCQQPLIARVEQLFDATADPGAKQRLLGGVSNHAICANCGFSGPLATPIVFHDADKELLLTYFPPELNLPVNEQEKIIGQLINQVLNKLPAEKRKAYLLQPKSYLTHQSLIENILGADGITPEMIQEQQKRISLIEELLSAATPETRSEIIKQETALFDADFFTIFSHLLENASASGQAQLTDQMNIIQQQLLTETEYGRKFASQAREIQEAVKSLQAAGKDLDREKLLNLLIEAPNDDRLNALTSLTRPAIDYLFFQSLSERIETKTGSERKKLEELRENLLEITRCIDQRVEEEYKHAGELLNQLLSAEEIQKATLDHAREINDKFIQIFNRALEEANKNKNEEQSKKLQQIGEVLKKLSTPPPEVTLLEELLGASDEAALNNLLDAHAEEIKPEFASFVGSILAQSEGQEKSKIPEDEFKTMDKLQNVYRAVLKYSMKKSMK